MGGHSDDLASREDGGFGGDPWALRPVFSQFPAAALRVFPDGAAGESSPAAAAFRSPMISAEGFSVHCPSPSSISTLSWKFTSVLRWPTLMKPQPDSLIRSYMRSS